MTTPARCQNWVVIVPIAAVAAAYVYFVFLPNRRVLAELREQTKTKQDIVAGATGIQASLGQARRDLEKAKTYVAACRQRLAKEKDLGTVFGKIHELADEAKVHVTRFDPQQPVVYEQLLRVPCLVGCTGSFDQIYEFLRKLESLPTVAWVSSMHLQKDGKGGASGKSARDDIILEVFAVNSEDSDYVKRSK